MQVVKLKDDTFFLFGKDSTEVKECYNDAIKLWKAKELRHVSMWAGIHGVEFQPLLFCLISKSMNKFLVRKEFDLVEIASKYNYGEI
jgi:hypothetical protein